MAAWLGGSFTLVFYAEIGVHVDWVLLPQKDVRREQESVLLFDKVGIPVELQPIPETLEQRLEKAVGLARWFWTMVPITLKYMLRDDSVYFHQLLDGLYHVISDVERLMANEPERYRGGSFAPLCVGRDEQIAQIRSACERMQELTPELEQLGATVPVSTMPIVEIWMAMAEDAVA